MTPVAWDSVSNCSKSASSQTLTVTALESEAVTTNCEGDGCWDRWAPAVNFAAIEAIRKAEVNINRMHLGDYEIHGQWSGERSQSVFMNIPGCKSGIAVAYTQTISAAVADNGHTHSSATFRGGMLPGPPYTYATSGTTVELDCRPWRASAGAYSNHLVFVDTATGNASCPMGSQCCLPK
jgi:hypothetical protein